ncbi:MAG: fibronectin type III domain-containing protein [Lachnospiraceae bacterium]
MNLPDGVQTIGYMAFHDCSGLKELVFPNSVQEIGKEAFAGCRKLKKVILPSGVEAIDMQLFTGCGERNEVLIESGKKQYRIWNKSLYTGDKKELIHACMKKEFHVPKGVKTIQKDAFADCEEMDKLILPASVTKIDTNVFAPCRCLSTITVAKKNPAYKTVNGLLYTKDGKTLVRSVSLAKRVEIPNGVKCIADSAFTGITNVNRVTIPASVTSDLTRVFYNCDGLNNIIVDKKNKKYKSIDGSLYSKDGKKLIQAAAKVFNMVLPKAVTAFDEQAFCNTHFLERLAFPNMTYPKEELRCLEHLSVSGVWKGVYCKKGSTVETVAKNLGISTGTLSDFEKDSPVRGVRVLNVKKDQIKLTWKKKSKVTGYEISYFNETTGKTSEMRVKGANKHTVVLKKLCANTKYWITVKAYTREKNEKDDRYSDESTTLRVKTLK